MCFLRGAKLSFFFEEKAKKHIFFFEKGAKLFGGLFEKRRRKSL